MNILHYFLRIFCIVSLLLTGCSSQLQTPQNPAIPTNTSIPTSSPLPSTTPSPQPTETPFPTNTPTIAAKFTRSIDVAAYASERDGQWFGGEFVQNFPDVSLQPSTTYIIPGSSVVNRRNGQISSTLASRYIFLQFGFDNLAPKFLLSAESTIHALFIRSALMSFVDYKGNRVLDWDGRSSTIPMDLKAVIKEVNDTGLYPIFLELNYSDYIPGNPGTDAESLQPADNIARTIEFLQVLEEEGLHIDGVTFGDEIGDQSNFGTKKPTMMNENIADRFIRYARAIKNAFPELKVYAFDSDVSAASGEMALYYDLFTQIHEAEVDSGLILLDGFIFRESYVYIDENGKLLDSQKILDDVESLYKPTKVYRYDSLGYSYKNPDKDYLHTLIEKTDEIFGRSLDIGLTEYLPAGPTQIDESDTSRYADIDFILHYADEWENTWSGFCFNMAGSQFCRSG